MSTHPWRECEFTLTAERDYPNPYADVEVWADCTLHRPAFWDGGRVWKIRFVAPGVSGRWTWRSFSSVADAGLGRQSGEIICSAESYVDHRFVLNPRTGEVVQQGMRTADDGEIPDEGGAPRVYICHDKT